MSENPILKLPQWRAEWFVQEDALEHIAPDWNTELEMSTIPVTHFVAMTMGCTWEIASGEEQAPVNLFAERRIFISDIYNKRLRILQNNTGAARSFPGYNGPEGPFFCWIERATQWVHERGWELPAPMLRLIKKAPKEKGLIQDDLPGDHPKWRKAFEYQSEWLDAFYQLIETYYFDAEGKPIYDPSQWPDKKTIESKKLVNRTLTEADTIITSGKRRGKAKK